MTLVYLDPIGTGKSGTLPGGDYSVPEYARRVELLRAQLGVTNGFLLGHSHGGFVTLQYGLDYPGRMRGLIVYDSAPTYSPDLIALAELGMTAFAERWPDRPEAVAAARAFMARQARELSVTDRASLLSYMTAILPAYFADFRKTSCDLGAPPGLRVSGYDPARKPYEWDVRGRLGAITEKSLVAVGTYDFICPPVWSRQIHAELPDSQLVEFTDSGHFPHLEQPEHFVEIILGFLNEVNRVPVRRPDQVIEP
jgi:proline iminopeptidase